MKLKSLIPKLLLSTALSFIIFLLISLLANMPMLESKLAIAALDTAVAISGSLVFCVFLVYFIHVYDGSGEKGIWEEYPNKYPGIFKDMIKIVKRDYTVILAILALGVSCTLLWTVNEFLFHNKLLDAITYLFFTTTSLAAVIDGPLGHLLGALTTCLLYVIVLAVFRRHWRKYM